MIDADSDPDSKWWQNKNINPTAFRFIPIIVRRVKRIFAGKAAGLSELPGRRAGGEFPAAPQKSVWGGQPEGPRDAGVPFLLVRFLWASKENEQIKSDAIRFIAKATLGFVPPLWGEASNPTNPTRKSC